jgi:galactose-1-phosphate uridylyltransferase
MTANELADKLLDSMTMEYDCDKYMEQAATMLRQQQAEIESLKEELKRYADAIGEERGNKALRNNEIGKILTKVLDDCGLLKKASEK